MKKEIIIIIWFPDPRSRLFIIFFILVNPSRHKDLCWLRLPPWFVDMSPIFFVTSVASISLRSPKSVATLAVRRTPSLSLSLSWSPSKSFQFPSRPTFIEPNMVEPVFAHPLCFVDKESSNEAKLSACCTSLLFELNYFVETFFRVAHTPSSSSSHNARHKSFFEVKPSMQSPVEVKPNWF